MAYATGSVQGCLTMLSTFWAVDIYLSFFMVWQNKCLEVATPLYKDLREANLFQFFLMFSTENIKHLFFLWNCSQFHFSFQFQGSQPKKSDFFYDFMPVLYTGFMLFLCLIHDFYVNFKPYFMKMFQKILEKQKEWSYSLMIILQCTLPIWRIKINKKILYCVKQTRQSNRYVLKKINRSFKYF